MEYNIINWSDNEMSRNKHVRPHNFKTPSRRHWRPNNTNIYIIFFSFKRDESL